jgi:hypothetical protein
VVFPGLAGRTHDHPNGIRLRSGTGWESRFFFSGASPDPARVPGRLDRAGDIDSVVVVAGPTKLERAHRLLEKAERACLISRSVSCTVTMEPRIVAVAATPV